MSKNRETRASNQDLQDYIKYIQALPVKKPENYGGIFAGDYLTVQRGHALQPGKAVNISKEK